MEARIQMYKADYDKAIQAEREAKKENLRLTFQNDELVGRQQYMEEKYMQLVQRVSASQEDLDAVEVIMASGMTGENLQKFRAIKSGNKDRVPSRHEKNRNGSSVEDEANNNYYMQSSRQKHRPASSNKGKKNIVEVLDFNDNGPSPHENNYNGQVVAANQAALF